MVGFCEKRLIEIKSTVYVCVKSPLVPEQSLKIREKSMTHQKQLRALLLARLV